MFNTTSAGKSKLQEAVDHNPATSGNRIPAANAIVNNELKGQYTGKAQNQPSLDKSYSKNTSEIQASEQLTRFVWLNFNTMGVPQLTPGIIEIQNMGVRYSGKYEIISVTHTINSTGYNCACSAKAFTISSGGVALPEAKKDSDKVSDKEAIKLFNEQTNRGSGTPKRDELEKTVGIK